jgi:hypothetical protein
VIHAAPEAFCAKLFSRPGFRHTYFLVDFQY